MIKSLVVALMGATLMLANVGAADARTHYSGSHHTVSHGGHYYKGHGSSHKGGHYRHLATSNHYGRHR
jgi:hypothetical protein